MAVLTGAEIGSFKAGDQGRGDRAFVARQHRADAVVDLLANSVERAGIAQPEASVGRRLDRRDGAERKAGGPIC